MLERGGGQQASDKELVKYREIVGRIADDLQVPLARYSPLLDAQTPKEMVGIDGVHPSPAAHRLIAQALLPVLSNALFSPKLKTRPDAVSAR
jgi:lysophospholipase L1-like esterase